MISVTINSHPSKLPGEAWIKQEQFTKEELDLLKKRWTDWMESTNYNLDKY